MLKACQAPWCTAHRYSSFPAKSHVIPVSLPSVHSLLAAELGSKSSDRGARVNIHIYRAEGSFHLPFERMQHFIRMNFRTLGRRTSLLTGASNVYISMHLPLLRVGVVGSKSSGRHTYTGAIQHDRVVHLAAVSKDMPSSVASSVRALPHSEEITLTDQTEFNDLFSLNGLEVSCKHLLFRSTMGINLKRRCLQINSKTIDLSLIHI